MKANEVVHISRKYLPGCSDMLDQLLSYEVVKSEEPIVVVYGIYNAGKSSLLNSLTGHVEQEYFATRDVPETRSVKTLVHDGLCFLDTPGLDVNAEDTLEANNAGRQADLIMLVHKLSAGSIQKEDLKALKKLLAAHGEHAQAIAVLTEGETASKNQQLIKEITKQLDTLVPGCKPFVVSNTGFRKGVLENKQALVNHSGIPQLKETLQSKKQNLARSLQRTRTLKQSELKSKLLDALKERQNKIQILLGLEAEEQAQYEQECIAATHQLQSQLQNN